jgi:hypothetical protein
MEDSSDTADDAVASLPYTPNVFSIDGHQT